MSSSASADSPGRGAMNPPMQENIVGSYNDRFIPSRSGSNLEAGFAFIDEQHRAAGRSSPSTGEGAGGGAANQPTLNMLLRSELLGLDCVSPKHERTENGDARAASGRSPVNMLRFQTALDTMTEDPRSIYDLSPVNGHNRNMLMSPGKPKRKIPKVHFLVNVSVVVVHNFHACTTSRKLRERAI
jgi:hypothetical protein